LYIMSTAPRIKAFVLVPLAVFIVMLFFLTVGYLATLAVQIPPRLGFPLSVRVIGFLILLSGFLFLGWLFIDRAPVNVLVSTYVTFSKAARRIPIEERSGRTEPLVVKGPYQYVRHPLYSGVLLLFLGWWLLLDLSFILVSTLLLLLWFNFVVAPFEEKELRAMFGEDYEHYAKRVPRIIPFTTRHKKEE
jgi:protein-S-isoprenylcysteine O-methyltransferase Ste14